MWVWQQSHDSSYIKGRNLDLEDYKESSWQGRCTFLQGFISSELDSYGLRQGYYRVELWKSKAHGNLLFRRHGRKRHLFLRPLSYPSCHWLLRSHLPVSPKLLWEPIDLLMYWLDFPWRCFRRILRDWLAQKSRQVHLLQRTGLWE